MTGSIGLGRRCIGLVVDTPFGSETARIVRGIADESERQNADLIVYGGGAFPLVSEFWPAYDDTGGRIDFLRMDCIVVAGDYGSGFPSQGDIEGLSNLFPRTRVIYINIASGDFPSLGIDRFRGFTDLITHLIEAHGKNKIALILDPKDRILGNAATDVYKKTISEHGLGFDPALLVSCGSGEAGGKRAIGILIDEMHCVPDAVVAIGGSQAIGAIKELASRGIRVPDAMAVVSFGKAPDTQSDFLSVTYVYAPLYDLGRIALDVALECILSNESQAKREVPAYIALRESCGCMPLRMQQEGNRQSGVISVESIRRYFPEMDEMLASNLWLDPLVAARAGEFFDLTRVYARKIISEDGDSLCLVSICDAIRNSDLSGSNARDMLSVRRIVEGAEGQARAAREEEIASSREVCNLLESAEELNEIERIITEKFPAIGFLLPELFCCDNEISLRENGIDGTDTHGKALERERVGAGDSIALVMRLGTKDSAIGYFVCKLALPLRPVCSHVIGVLKRALNRVMHATGGECIPDAREDLPRFALQYGLSAREQDVLAHIVAGLMNKEIGIELGIALKTVEVHIGHIFEKFGVTSRLELLSKLAETERSANSFDQG